METLQPTGWSGVGPPRPGRGGLPVGPPRPGRGGLPVGPPRPGRGGLPVGPPRPGRVGLPGTFTNDTHVHDLFHEDAQGSERPRQPWWRVQLFVWEPVLFGTWDGVFTTCMINIFGVVLFLRTGFLVGNTGVVLGMLLVSAVVLVALVTVTSGIGLCERCGTASGAGVYSMISTALGGRVGATVGLLYVFGQCVAGAMYITGFSESVAEVVGMRSDWAVRGMSATVLLALLAINLAGVRWIVRLQLLLLALLAVSTLDFVLGTFTHLDPEHGFVGYSPELLSNNSLPDYSPGENFFTVFGVFFPAATGVMAGFNMSSDLQRPEHNIPVGTLAAVFTSWFLYLVFVFLLGAICTREALRYDFLIAEKVSLVGFLFLLGLYISSLASCMGGLYGAPRILQTLAQDRVIPALAFLGKGRGPNKTPVAGICLTSLLTMVFVFIGQVNLLAPIVTINFMLTYSVIHYSYFSVAMAYRLQAQDKAMAYRLQAQEKREAGRTAGLRASAKQSWNWKPLPEVPKQSWKPLLGVPNQSYGSSPGSRGGGGGGGAEGTLLEFTRDMDQIFQTAPNGTAWSQSAPSGPEESSRCKSRRANAKLPTKQMLMDSFGLETGLGPSPDQEGGPGEPRGEPGPPAGPGPWDAPGETPTKPGHHELEQPAPPQRMNTANGDQPEQQGGSEIRPMPDSSYANLCNHWVALMGAVCSILIMLVIQWVYALVNITVALLLFLYIGRTSPGLPIGAASRFSFFRWLRSTLSRICRRPASPRDQMVVTPSLWGVGTETRQLTQDNTDFSSRHRCHQSSIILPSVLHHQ